jgi:maltooligosyltrehalose trehalohydrolase
MHRFTVWAPNAAGVQVLVEGKLETMTPCAGGWYEAGVEHAGPGTRYGFVLDGSAPLPDPRSASQPLGVHGFSELVDHSAFEWADAHWQAPPLGSAIVYEMHVGTFTPEGTFDSAIGRLEYLHRLGITHVELLPVVEFPGQWGWGYDGVDLFAPHHTYGGPEGLKRFVNAAHRSGLAVLLDVVYNHLGPSGNYLARYGPYFTHRHKTPWGEAMNLDGPHSGDVRKFLLDNARMWLRDYHFDGLRLDAVHALIDNSATHFLEELAVEVQELGIHLGRHFVLIAESDLNDPRIVRPRELGGYGTDAQWSDDFHHALHTTLTGESNGYYSDYGGIEQLAQAIKYAFVYNGRYSKCRKRRHGRPIGELSGHKFLGYIQTHDQIGNRARGERISHLVSTDAAKVAAGLVLTSPFIPMLFQGEEWAASTPFQYFTHHEDPELGTAVSEGRRNEFVDFGWTPSEIPDPQERATFEASKLRWEDLQEEPHAQMLEWHRNLIALRRQHRELTDGDLDAVRVEYSRKDEWLIVVRGSITIAANFSRRAQCLPVQDPRRILIASAPELEYNQCGIRMGPQTFAAIRTGTGNNDRAS